MGDTFTNISNSIIATRGSIAEGVIKLENTGNNDIADAIKLLDKAIAEVDDKDFPEDKKKESLELLDEIAQQAQEESPKKTILNLLGTSLLKIIENIKPITTTAGKAIEVVQQFCL